MLMLTVLSYATQAVFFLVVLCFILYVLLELRVLGISRRVERHKLTELASQLPGMQALPVWPQVSVLLPIYNEAAVVVRLIDAVCRLQYPISSLEILVLDDSTDNTSTLAQARIDYHADQGVPIRYIRRASNDGYKAGNLLNGIRQSSGEFYVIFDADFVPPEDFLLRIIPYFQDPQLGFLQTGIGYENRDASFLTRFQAMEMGHQQYVTVGLSEDGDMASLSGSSCVWRRACVVSLGGWNASTVTEDVDLGYRAQFGNWKYAYVRDVVSISVLPETTSAFRVQRERWGRGLIHSAFKHVRQMFQQRMPLMKRLHAIAMMFSSLLLASIYILLLLCLPLSYLADFEGLGIHWVAWLFFGFVAIWGLNNVFAARKGDHIGEQRGILRTLWETYLYVAMFLPMAWYYFAGGMRALFGVHGDFHRTPKGGSKKSVIRPPVHKILWMGDGFSFGYSAITLWVAIQKANYFLIPISVTACLGFGMMLVGFWQEERSIK